MTADEAYKESRSYFYFIIILHRVAIGEVYSNPKPFRRVRCNFYR